MGSMEKAKLEQLRIERGSDRQASSRRWLIPLITAAVVLVAASWFWLRPEPAAGVRIAVARSAQGQSAGTVLNASGYVTARRQATVSSKVTGKVTEILIEEGMSVEKGQVLARLDDTNIVASFQLGEAQLKSAQKALKETAALLAEAEANFERTQDLITRGVASEAELDRTRAQAESLAAQLERKQADVEVAERQLDVYRQLVEDTIIRAPFAGVVVAKNAQPGEMISPVSAGGGFTRTGIGTIVDMGSLEIEIDVNETYINRVEAGQRVVATLDAYPDWQIPCRVIAIIPTADRQRATVEVRVGFDQLDPRILPDMGVKVAFQEAVEAAALVLGVIVPAAAVIGRDGRDVVWVVNNGRVERRAVAVAAVRGEDMLLSSGLESGESVVIEGPADLADGDSVEEADK
jgi:RND family efflux transporter MFP subunit